MSSIDSYQYTVKIAGKVNKLAAGPLKDKLKQVAEVAIVSKPFSNYATCVSTASQLIGQFSQALSEADGTEYVIVSKKNPLYDKESNEIVGETWDPLTLAKLYAADAKLLKESTLKYLISADIRADAQVVQAARELLPPEIQ